MNRVITNNCKVICKPYNGLLSNYSKIVSYKQFQKRNNEFISDKSINYLVINRYLSTNNTQDKPPEDIKPDNSNNNTINNNNLNNNSSIFSLTKSLIFSFKDNVVLAYKELTGESKPSLLKTKLDINPTYKKNSTDDDEDDKYEGPTSIVVVNDNLNPWDQMKARLQNSTLIRSILKGSQKITEVASNTTIGKQAQQVTETVKDKIEDIREIWETSQNPIIYTLSGVWENMTSETEEAMTVSTIKKLDKNFRKDEWAEETKDKLAAPLIKSHLQGDIKEWKSWLGEGVFKKLQADIIARKHDGYVFDSNILNIDHNQVVMKLVDSGRPVIVVVYLVQLINCIRNRKGEIIEGGESELRAKFYSMAYEQHYNDDTGEVFWRIFEYEFVGDTPYTV